MNPLLDIRELASLLNVPVSWIYDRTRKGSSVQIPHYKIGKYVRFDKDEVLKFLKISTAKSEQIDFAD